MKQETNTDTELRTLLHSYTSKNSAASNIQTFSAAELLQSESSLRTISEPVQRGLKRKRSSDSDSSSGSAMQTRFHTVFESATDPSTNRLKACESRLTVKSPQSDESAAKAKAKPSIICPLVTERLGDRLCPDIVLEHGQFKDAGVQGKALRNSEPIPELSLSVFLRERQQNSRDILSVKGRCILAAGLAAALLPFLETPFTRNAIHSSVVCFHAPAGDELPNLALPFLKVSKRALTSSAKGKNGCPANHRQPSIQEFGVLLMEIYYCQIAPREGERGDKYNCKTRWQVCVDRLPCFKAYAPRNYYLAAEACLEWEDGINDRGSFDGAEAQEYFYQAVVKRLESVIYKKWNLTLSDLVKIDASEQKDCWGPVARQAYTHFKSQTKHQKIHPEMGQ
ncbi:hypothetical protein LMH87_004883 [Akanthomyces muscarius]|uniref:DUF7580 domain-containing protein n=1 Tax=Akanthomyces muscarius TaxID=2231603 RepID=A0A9W8UI34_AKAMU|nr:hypothetical protein LMH87_004883 [Akanthomyces muscarius]KAJ4146053.1 hypothetical protein LMH87_004883 [Akanthomyces muscarius]